MPKFTQGKWKCDFEEDKYIWSCDEKFLGELYFTTPEGTKVNARLITCAPEMYELLKEGQIPTSYYGGIVSFERERKIKELLARIGGDKENAES